MMNGHSAKSNAAGSHMSRPAVVPALAINLVRMKIVPARNIGEPKAVVEQFARNFLGMPGVIWLSESGHKVVARDDQLASEIGLTIEPDKHLPDIILVDLAPDHPLLIFVDVVATDGPVNDLRKAALLDFVTAFQDRSRSAFKKAVETLAWGSYAWFASQPENLCDLHATSHKLKG